MSPAVRQQSFTGLSSFQTETDVLHAVLNVVNVANIALRHDTY